MTILSFSTLLLIPSLLFAQSILCGNNSGCKGPFQIKSGQELDNIRNCQVIEGSITIQNMSSSTDLLNLSQLQQVHGDLIIDGNSDISQVVLASLKQVDGQLKFQNNLQLKRLDLTQLTSVQSLEISVQPALDMIQFPSGLSQIDTFKVTDTIASKIEGLTTSKMKDIYIANNVYLKDINLNHLQQVGGVISISANSPNLSLDVSCAIVIILLGTRNLVLLHSSLHYLMSIRETFATWPKSLA
jgi:hypothetical protein